MGKKTSKKKRLCNRLSQPKAASMVWFGDQAQVNTVVHQLTLTVVRAVVFKPKYIFQTNQIKTFKTQERKISHKKASPVAKDLKGRCGRILTELIEVQ